MWLSNNGIEIKNFEEDFNSSNEKIEEYLYEILSRSIDDVDMKVDMGRCYISSRFYDVVIIDLDDLF